MIFLKMKYDNTKMSKQFDLIPEDLIYIISSFLLPRDLCRFRILSKSYATILTNYLRKYKKMTVLIDLICPMCANDWISEQDNLYGYCDLDDNLHFFDIIERNKFVSSQFYSIFSREHLLCDECENHIQENCSTSYFKLQSSMPYQIRIDYCNMYPWACIFTYKNGMYRWNQFNCYIENDDKVEWMSDISETSQDFYDDWSYTNFSQ